MKGNRRTFDGAQRVWVAERARAGVPVAEIVTGLNAAFGTGFAVKQVRGLVATATIVPWTPPQGSAEAKARAIIQNVDTRELRPEEAERVMGQFAARAEQGANKAFDMVDDAKDARELVSAVSAVKTLVMLTRLTLHMDDAAPEKEQGKEKEQAVFDFNFANVRLPGESAEGGSSVEP